MLKQHCYGKLLSSLTSSRKKSVEEILTEMIAENFPKLETTDHRSSQNRYKEKHVHIEIIMLKTKDKEEILNREENNSYREKEMKV